MRSRLTLFLAATMLAACPEPVDDDTTDDTDVEDTDLPPEAWGPAGDDPLLDGADLLTEEEFGEVEDRSFTITPDAREQGLMDEEAEREADESFVRDKLMEKGLEDSPFARMLDEIPEDDDDLVMLPDGTYQLVVRDPETDDVINRVVTMGQPQLIRGMREVFERIEDPDNHVDAYRELYEDMPPQVYDLGLPTPEEVEVLQPEEQLSVLAEFVELQGRILAVIPPGGLAPAGRPATCDGEIGAGDNTDRSQGATNASTFSSNGIYENYQWPLKWYATCVKDQANRGTCGSFGITAAMETQVALDQDIWVNLSEQDLYYRLRGDWNPSTWGDGLNTHNSWWDMINNDYTQPFEDDWPYNPSRARISNKTSQTYTNSCVGYQFFDPPSGIINNYCSDTVHQGGPWCVNLIGFQFCGWSSPVPSDNTDGYSPIHETEIWDATKPDFSLALAIIATAIRKPAVLWAHVTPAYDGATTDGFVTYAGSGEGNRGSHIYQITGHISNAQLEAILPNAPPGSGGGYIIAKNSWGDAWADAGYVYLPYDWVEDYTISLTLLHGVD